MTPSVNSPEAAIAPELPTDSVPAELAEFWKEDSRDEIQFLARWAGERPKATAGEIAQARYAIRLELAQRAAAKASTNAERRAALEAASTCPSCKVPGTLRIARIPDLGQEDRPRRQLRTVADVEMAAWEARHARREDRDEDREPLVPRYRPEPQDQIVGVTVGAAPLFVCSRCRPMVEAALVEVLGQELVSDKSRGELARDFAEQVVARRQTAAAAPAARAR